MYIRGIRQATDDGAFPSDLEQRERETEGADDITDDGIVWTGMYDGSDAETDWTSQEDFTYDPDNHPMMKGY